MDDGSVELMIDSTDGGRKPLLFQCCHIGMVFYSPEPIENYKQINFNLSIIADSDEDIPLNCKGVVVDSDYEEEKDMYKTFLLYTDIDGGTKERLKKISEERELKCPFCLKF